MGTGFCKSTYNSEHLSPKHTHTHTASTCGLYGRNTRVDLSINRSSQNQCVCTHTHMHTYTQNKIWNGLSQHPHHIQVCSKAKGRLIGKWTESTVGDQDLVTGRGATVYRWRSSRHTWSHTHTGWGEEMCIAAVVGGPQRSRQTQAWAKISKYINVGKDGNYCVNTFTRTVPGNKVR